MNFRRRAFFGALLIASLTLAVADWMHGSGGSAQSSSSAKLTAQVPATTLPSIGNTADALLPSEFAILQTRNAFRHGPGGASGGPESTLVFKGAVLAGATYTAFIEDLAAKKVVQAAVGDPVGRGRIKSIDLDTIEYASAGNSRKIEVGQNLDGVVVPPPPLPATQPWPPENNPAAPSPRGGPPGPPPQ